MRKLVCIIAALSIVFSGTVSPVLAAEVLTDKGLDSIVAGNVEVNTLTVDEQAQRFFKGLSNANTVDSANAVQSNVTVAAGVLTGSANVADVKNIDGPTSGTDSRTTSNTLLLDDQAQSLDYSCGPAALATLLSYYFGDKITEVDILEVLLTTCDIDKVKAKQGFSLLDLKRFAQARGYKVVGYKMDLEFLVELDKPVLIPVSIKDYSHFVIFRGLKGNRVFIADPVLGNMTMRYEKFEKIWEGGIGLVLNKEGEEALEHSPLRINGEEGGVFADSTSVQRLFGVNSLGRLFADGDF